MIQWRELADEARQILDDLYNRFIEEHGAIVGSMLFEMAAKRHGNIDLSKANQVALYERFIFEQSAPIKVGDIVQLEVEIDFEKAYGWKSSRCFLQSGARGEATAVELRERKDGASVDFLVGVRWFDQTWVDADGKEHPVKEDRYGTYFHWASGLKKLPPNLRRGTALKSS